MGSCFSCVQDEVEDVLGDASGAHKWFRGPAGVQVKTKLGPEVRGVPAALFGRVGCPRVDEIAYVLEEDSDFLHGAPVLLPVLIFPAVNEVVHQVEFHFFPVMDANAKEKMEALSSYLQADVDVRAYEYYVPPLTRGQVSTDWHRLSLDGVVRQPALWSPAEVQRWQSQVTPLVEECVDEVPGTLVQTKAGLHCLTFAPGRQDLWDVSPWVDLVVPAEVERRLQRASPSVRLVRSSMGVLPLRTDRHGPWHRDVVPLFGDALNVPDFYWTLFVPLTAVKPEAGSTQMVLGSHRGLELGLVDPVLDAGDLLIMNGKMLHRSTPCPQRRDLLYVIYCAHWYNESKF